jgi:hypothetical protein
MNQCKFNLIAVAIGFTVSAGAMAQGMSQSDYQASKDKIGTEYKAAKEACKSLSGNANDICEVDAKGKEKVSLAELEATYKPSKKSRYNVDTAKADAAYELAKEKCDDKSGNVKDVCVKEAKSTFTAAKADAEVQLKTADANATANEKSAGARKDAAEDKSDARYSLAKEKCDAYAGAAKDRCLEQAKSGLGK